jgi:membrane protein DedA with SNARE-associated domain
MISLTYIRHFVEVHYIIVYAVIILGVIIEGEIVVILAGIFSNLGSLNFIIALVAVIVGGILKSIIGYSLGLYLQNKHQDRWLVKQAEHKIHHFLPRFTERPFWSIFASRFLVLGLYWFTLIYAGYKEVERDIFIRAEMASLAIWSVGVLSLGFFFSFTALAVSRDVRNFLIIILVCFVAFFILEKVVAFIIELVGAEEKWYT